MLRRHALPRSPHDDLHGAPHNDLRDSFYSNLVSRCTLALLERYFTWRTLGLLASCLRLSKQEVETVIRYAGSLEGLEDLSLQDLEGSGVSESAAQKLFYFAQWDKLQRHLECYDALPDPADLSALLATLIPIRERHFRRAHISAPLIASYRAYLRHIGSERG